MRSLLVRVLLVLGAVSAGLGVVAGHINRQVLDGPTFAHNVDKIRREPAVSTALGRAITAQLIGANPDLIALRPLIEEVAIRAAGSEALSGATRVAARTAQEALTRRGGASVVLRIVDAGAVVTAVLHAVAPDRTPVTADVSVTLASIGDQSFARSTIMVARTVGVLAWALPLAALLCFGAAVGFSRSRWRTAAGAGRSVVWAATVLGVLLVAGGLLVRRFDETDLTGAVARAAWTTMIRPLWGSVAVLAAVGVAVAMACDSSAPQKVLAFAARARDAVLSRPRQPAAVIVRAVVAVVIGVVAVLDPIGLVEPLIVVGGVGLVLYGLAQVAQLASAANQRDRGPDDVGRASRSRPRALIALAVVAVVVAAGVVVQSRPGRVLPAVAGDGLVCNGHAELCGRRFTDVAYVASHNAMSVAREPGWYLPEQLDPIPVQLDQGVRALLIDVWSGRRAGAVVRTAAGSRPEALAVARAELGPEVVTAALRVADSIAGSAEGPEARYLCHGLCEAGSTPFADTLAELREWLATHPDEVLTLFIEDHVAAPLIAADIEAAGLLPSVYTPARGEPWPTLGDMIRSGRRLVVMLEAGTGGPDAPWLTNGFTWTQETPYTFPTVESFSCVPNRGSPDAPLFLLNHWLAGFNSLISDARLVNGRDVLLPRAQQCRRERHQIPNFIAVNFVAIGDVYDAVNTLNGVT
jgi:hypothetical protein